MGGSNLDTENQDETLLVVEDMEESLLGGDESGESLLDSSDTDFETTLVADSETTDIEKSIKAQEKRMLMEKERLAELAKPEVQAKIMAENYIKSQPYVINRADRKRIYRECLKNAKKGKYRSYFIPESIAKREERERAKIDKLNKD